MRLKAALVLGAMAAFVASPWFTGGFAGFDPGAFPVPQDRPPVQPAGYAFGIWGLIYLALAAHGLAGLLRHGADPAWDAGRWPLIASLGVGAGWIAAANAAPLLATAMIWAMLAGAVWALASGPRGPGAAGRWLGQAPVALYAGWLSAASFVSLGLVLAGYGLMSEAAAALVALPLATGFAVAVQLRLRGAPEYGAAVIWGLAGIVVANLNSQPLVAALALAGAAAVAAAAWRAARHRP